MVRPISLGQPPSRLFPVVAAGDRDANHALTTACAKAGRSPVEPAISVPAQAATTRRDRPEVRLGAVGPDPTMVDSHFIPIGLPIPTRVEDRIEPSHLARMIKAGEGTTEVADEVGIMTPALARSDGER